MASYRSSVHITREVIIIFSPGFLPNGGLHRLSPPFTTNILPDCLSGAAYLQAALGKCMCNNNEFYPF